MNTLYLSNLGMGIDGGSIYGVQTDVPTYRCGIIVKDKGGTVAVGDLCDWVVPRRKGEDHPTVRIAAKLCHIVETRTTGYDGRSYATPSCYGYEPDVPEDFVCSYTKAGILDFVNRFSAVRYDAVEFVDSHEDWKTIPCVAELYGEYNAKEREISERGFRERKEIERLREKDEQEFIEEIRKGRAMKSA